MLAELAPGASELASAESFHAGVILAAKPVVIRGLCADLPAAQAARVTSVTTI